MSPTVFVVDDIGAQAALKRAVGIARYADRGLGAAAEVVRREEVRLAPKADGDLMRSIQKGRLRELMWEIVARSAHAAFVELGTPPHPGQQLSDAGLARIVAWLKRKGIAPRAGRKVEDLAWVIGRKIARDGSRKQPFAEPALNVSKNTVVELVRNQVKIGLQELGLT